MTQPPPPAPIPGLVDLRASIDAVDDRLLNLLNERAASRARWA